MSGKAKVLVVDDDRDVADSLAGIIEARGHSVWVAYDGEEAMRLALELRFDVGFLDVVLPGKNGVESLFDLKRLQPGMAIYMMTGFSVADLIARALAGGALGILRKPVAPEEVLSLLPPRNGGSLLIADEDGDLSDSLAPALNEAGWPTLAVSCSEDAKMRAADAMLDAMIVDIDAPLLGSMEVCAELWRMGRRLPTVIVTPEEEEVKPVAPGNVCHLFKPVDPVQVLSLIDKVAPGLRVAYEGTA
jgi:DNA-binding NtrC family response regulator